ncbi:FKBP-type peptidyl-prolyl cis-trans isomerase [Luteimicrobium xylanilyticum]|uniref:FKBP-type peptidyl-prolyl cis-trans isomerase n=1 Tax=Luteimicrobium xylanilyticum TaxID=1133546 RepID=UPI0004B5AA77|nr:FKBP-type peptidyl-prolyl cis-trans isomerase [Luteimicrobium xylanilyticum]
MTPTSTRRSALPRRRRPDARGQRRGRAVAALVLVAGLVGTVAACGEEDPQDQTTVTGATQADVQVTGSAWSPPAFGYDTPLTVTQQRLETVWEGVGPKVEDGDVVVLDTYAEDGRTRKVVANSFAGEPRAVRVDEKTLGTALYRMVVGRTSGSRVLDVAESKGVPLVTTVDVLAGRAVGETVAQSKGEPVVTRADDGAPSVKIPKGTKAPSELAVLPLVRGTGPQVQAGQLVTVQYTGVTWADGKVFDTTWGSKKLPLTFRLGVGEVIEGWDQGLLELPVGSQVMLVVPPDLAYQGTSSKLADQTLVFVVDILDAHTPGTGPQVGTKAKAAEATPSATSPKSGE